MTASLAALDRRMAETRANRVAKLAGHLVDLRAKAHDLIVEAKAVAETAEQAYEDTGFWLAATQNERDLRRLAGALEGLAQRFSLPRFGTEPPDGPWLTEDERENFYTSRRRWRDDKTPDNEAEYVRSTLAFLRVARWVAAREGDGMQTLVLNQISRIISDRLRGVGWPSLTGSATGGHTDDRLEAIGYAVAYVEAAREKRVLDAAPVQTVLDYYPRENGKRRAENAVRQWRAEADYPQMTIKAEKGESIEEATKRAKDILKFLGQRFLEP